METTRRTVPVLRQVAGMSQSSRVLVHVDAILAVVIRRGVVAAHYDDETSIEVTDANAKFSQMHFLERHGGCRRWNELIGQI